MPTRRPRAETHIARKLGAAIYRFKIDAYTPETMPMARLAEYIAQLAELLGEPTAVHFVKLEPGSTTVVHQVEYEAIPKVQERTASVRRGDGPSDAIRAYRKINRLLRDDNAVGFLQDKRAKAIIIRFPGREEVEETFTSLRQYGTIDGEIIRIGGPDRTVPILLKVEDQQVSGCWADRPTAKRLAQKLFEPVRLSGRERWNRDSEGRWQLESFKVESFEVLEDVPLSKAVERLRAIPVEWPDGAYDELQVIRHGPPRKLRDGGH